MHKYQKRILAGLIASASLAALVVVVLRRSQPPGSSQSDRRGISGEESKSDSAANPGAHSFPAHAGVDSGSPADSEADHVLTPGSIRTDPSSPEGHGKVPSVECGFPPVKDNEEKLLLLAQLADPRVPQRERLDAEIRLGNHLANKPTDEVFRLEILRAVQNAASSDPEDAIKKSALQHLMLYSDSRSFEIVVDRLFNDPSEDVQREATNCLARVNGSMYLRFVNPHEEGIPGLIRERRAAALAALKMAKIAITNENLAGDIDGALESFEE